MADLEEQRVCIKFCCLLVKTAAETATMLRDAFKEEALSQARVYEWFSLFKRCDMSLEDQPQSGRSSTSRTDENIKKFRDAIKFYRCRTIDEYEALTGVLWSSCQRILTEERPELWRSGEWLLHHDNVPTHTTLSVWQFLTKNGMRTASHPPTSRTWDPAIFFLFSRMKRDLKGKLFQNVKEVRKKNDEGTGGYRFVRVTELF
jgi:hypothetical protein